MVTEGTTVVPQTPLSPVASMAKISVMFPVPGFAHVKASPMTSEKEAEAAVDTCQKKEGKWRHRQRQESPHIAVAALMVLYDST